MKRINCWTGSEGSVGFRLGGFCEELGEIPKKKSNRQQVVV